MQQHQGKRALEKYTIFPYVAWTLTIGFALFVYNIATELQDVAGRLETQTQSLQRQIDNNNTANNYDEVIDARQDIAPE